MRGRVCIRTDGCNTVVPKGCEQIDYLQRVVLLCTPMVGDLEPILKTNVLVRFSLPDGLQQLRRWFVENLRPSLSAENG